MERIFLECLAIGQVVIILSCQLVLSMLHAFRRRRERHVILMQAAMVRRQRRAPYTWERHRSQAFWEVIVDGHFTASLWLQHFRMSKPTFERLCNMIGRFVGPMPSRRRPVPTRKRIAIALYKLATCAEYRVVAETFGVSKTTVHRCLYAVCRALRFKLLNVFVKLPDVVEAKAIADRNAMTHRVPQVYGALDGTHIPILPPTDGYRDYVNRKGWPSIILQALVDDQCQIRDICVGTPGSAHDAAVFVTSSLCRFPERHPKANTDVEGISVPLLIAGDPAYPLLPWLMKGFSGPNLTEAQEDYNIHLSAIRVKVEHTFGHLKGRWRILAKRSDVHHSFMPIVVAACCVLHNMCEKEKQRLPPELLEAHVHGPMPPREPNVDQPDGEAQSIREALVRHVARRRIPAAQ